MKSHLSEIIIAVIGVVAGALGTITAWKYGGRQKNETDRIQPLSDGTASIVASFERLVERLEMAVDAERKATHNCEEELKQVKRRLDEIEKRQNCIDN